MNDFFYQELLATEYRRDQMAIAEKHNRFTSPSGKMLNLSIYRTLSRTGELLENWGSRMQARYEHLAMHEECKMLPNAAE